MGVEDPPMDSGDVPMWLGDFGFREEPGSNRFRSHSTCEALTPVNVRGLYRALPNTHKTRRAHCITVRASVSCICSARRFLPIDVGIPVSASPVFCRDLFTALLHAYFGPLP